MFFGNLSLAGSSWAHPVIYLFSLSTIFVKLIALFTEPAQWCGIYSAILAWPTFTEAIFMPFVIWACRCVGRMLGRKGFLNLMIYNVVIYVPVWGVLARNADGMISLAWIYPYAVFVFVVAHVPAIPVVLIVTDKMITCLVFLLCFAIALPYSIAPMCCAIVGNVLWSYDVAKLGNCGMDCCADDEGSVQEFDSEELSETENRISGLEMMTNAGYSFPEAVYALQRNRSDPRRACEFLMMQ